MKLLSRFFGRGLTCQQVAVVLQQYLDEELDPNEVPKVLEHLDACKDCGLEATIYTRIKASLHAHQEEPDDASMAKIRALATELATAGLPDNE